MFAKTIKLIDPGFKSKGGDAIRANESNNYLYEHISIKKDRDGYFCRLGVFIRDGSDDKDNGHMGLNLPEFAICKNGVDIMPISFSDSVDKGFHWKAGEEELLASKYLEFAPAFFDKWCDTQFLIDYFLFEQGEGNIRNRDDFSNLGLKPHPCQTNQLCLETLLFFQNKQSYNENSLPFKDLLNK